MRELCFERLSEDGTQLILEDGNGVAYTVAVDDTLASAVRRGLHRTSTRQASGSLTPRDIQALIRQGVSVEEVAAQTHLTRDFVERFAEPVMAEMDFVIQRARRLSVHSAGHQVPVETLVERAARRDDVGVEDLQWTTRKTDEAAWRIEAFSGDSEVLALVFRVNEGTVVPADVATADLLTSPVVDLTDSGRIPAHWDAQHPATKAAVRSAAAHEAEVTPPMPDDPSRIF